MIAKIDNRLLLTYNRKGHAELAPDGRKVGAGHCTPFGTSVYSAAGLVILSPLLLRAAWRNKQDDGDSCVIEHKENILLILSDFS
jgi:hypothetical protein